MRKTELEQVSTESGAQIVYLEDKKDKTGKAK
jgi:hypothetical protein